EHQGPGGGPQVEGCSEFILEEGLRLASTKGGYGPVEEGFSAAARGAVEQAHAGHQPARGRYDEALGLALGPAVGQDRLGGVVFAIPGARAVEDQVGRGEDEPPVAARAPVGEPGGRLDVDGEGPAQVAPDGLRGADRGRVDDDLRV